MSTHADKIREALLESDSWFSDEPDPKDGGSEMIQDIRRMIKDAVAALSELEAQPQPANEGAEPGLTREEAKTLIRNMRERCRSGQCDAATSTPQPAKVLTDEEIERLKRMAYPNGTNRQHFYANGLRYARDNGYLAPAQPAPTDNASQWINGNKVPAGTYTVEREFAEDGPRGGQTTFDVATCDRHGNWTLGNSRMNAALIIRCMRIPYSK